MLINAIKIYISNLYLICTSNCLKTLFFFSFFFQHVINFRVFYFSRFLIQQRAVLVHARTCGNFLASGTEIVRLNTRGVFSANWNSLVEIRAVSRLLSIEFPFFFSFFPFQPRAPRPPDYRNGCYRERKLDNFDFLFDVKRATFTTELLSREISCSISYRRFRQTIVFLRSFFLFCLPRLSFSLFLLVFYFNFSLSFLHSNHETQKRIVGKLK